MAQQTSCGLWFRVQRSLLLIYHVRDKWFRSEEFIWRWPCLTAFALITLSAKLGSPLSLRAGSEGDLGDSLLQNYFCTVSLERVDGKISALQFFTQHNTLIYKQHVVLALTAMPDINWQYFRPFQCVNSMMGIKCVPHTHKFLFVLPKLSCRGWWYVKFFSSEPALFLISRWLRLNTTLSVALVITVNSASLGRSPWPKYRWVPKCQAAWNSIRFSL